MKNNLSDLFNNADLVPVYDQVPGGGRIIPRHDIRKHPLRGVYVESRVVPKGEDYGEFTVHTFLLQDNSLVTIYGDYKLNKQLEGKRGYMFDIHFVGQEKIDGGRSVNMYKFQESKRPVLSPNELAPYITEMKNTPSAPVKKDDDDLPF